MVKPSIPRPHLWTWSLTRTWAKYIVMFSIPHIRITHLRSRWLHNALPLGLTAAYSIWIDDRMGAIGFYGRQYRRFESYPIQSGRPKSSDDGLPVFFVFLTHVPWFGAASFYFCFQNRVWEFAKDTDICMETIRFANARRSGSNPP